MCVLMFLKHELSRLSPLRWIDRIYFVRILISQLLELEHDLCKCSINMTFVWKHDVDVANRSSENQPQAIAVRTSRSRPQPLSAVVDALYHIDRLIIKLFSL